MFDINEFIQNQVELLNIEKNCYIKQVEEDKKLCGTLCGKVVRKTEPRYGGTIVTLQLISTLKNAELPLKQGSPVGLRDVNNDDFYRGIVVLIQ